MWEEDGFPRLLNADQVSAILSISTDRFYELARLRVIPVVRLGRQVRVCPDRLQKWIEEGGSQSRN